MNGKRYKLIIYTIATAIVVTIAIQLYWNYTNFAFNKQRVINEIQVSLDNALEEYYTNLSKESYMAVVNTETGKLPERIPWDSIFKKTSIKKSKSNTKPVYDSITFGISSVEITSTSKQDFKSNEPFIHDSIFSQLITHDHKDIEKPFMFTQIAKDGKTGYNIKPGSIESVNIFKGKKAVDSLKFIKGIETIFITLQHDSLEYKKVDSLLTKQLTSKGIKSSYYIDHFKEDTLFYSTKIHEQEILPLSTLSKSTYIKPEERIQLHYSNPLAETFKRSLTGILLSLMLSLVVILSLFYLLHIIKKQKELAEIKNDLISNITHEFKTPIATVTTAIEGIKNFNQNNDKEKTNKYLDISNQQLQKLHLMVEKLLETATLDSDKLIINKEAVEIVSMLKALVNKHQLLVVDKVVSFSTNISSLTIEVDPFHFENAISNLIDNAIKYGGDEIQLNLNSLLEQVEITVADNGGKIDKCQREKIFDKFYRIPTGNVHNVKGFGIGLFYTKKITEKHGGSINLLADTKNTVFKILL